MANRNLSEGYEDATVNEDVKDEAPINDEEQKKVIKQIVAENNLAFKITDAKKTQALKRLKLYNNQKRDQSKVGDPLLFTVFNTVLAALYKDKLNGTWKGREEGDNETAENLTAIYKYDHTLMKRSELNYYWDWDACFFGKGYVKLNEFDRKRMCPIAELLDPMTFLRDPRAQSINGDQMHRNSARFFGRPIGLTKYEMEDSDSYFNLSLLEKGEKDIQSTKDKAKEARDEAQNLNTSKLEEALTENYEYQLLEWYTVIQGKKYIVTLANDKKLIVRYKLLKDQEDWPIIERSIFPIAHDFDGVSIPDLIEDKQRARSVMINLGMESAIEDLYSGYFYNKSKIKNVNDLDVAQRKYVAVDGDPANAIVPKQKSTFHSQVNLILNILDVAAQKSVAAPEVSQGVQPGKERTLGETELVAAGSDARHSLSARVFGWSEEIFARRWYWAYKTYFKNEIDEKVLRLEGPLAPIFRTLTRDNLITKIDPDVYIESTYIAEATKRKKFNDFFPYFQFIVQDPTVNRRFGFRQLGSLIGESKMMLDFLIPPTIDEMISEDENKKIDNNKLPKINFADDDLIHLGIHNKASDTKAKLAHIEAHKLMMMAKKMNPMIGAPEQQTQFQQVQSAEEGQTAKPEQSNQPQPNQPNQIEDGNKK